MLRLLKKLYSIVKANHSIKISVWVKELKTRLDTAIIRRLYSIKTRAL